MTKQFKVFTPTTLTAADVNDYLMEQAVIAAESTDRPTPQEGMMIWETNTNRLKVYDGSGWKDVWATGTYTPTLAGMAIGTGGGASNTAAFGYAGGVLTVAGRIVFGTSGVTLPGAGDITVTVPSGFTMTSSVDVSTPIGDVSLGAAGAISPGVCWWNTSTTVRFLALNSAGTYLAVAAPASTVPATWVNGDTIRYSFSVPATF